MKKEAKKTLLDILKGVLLFIALWLINTFIAFIPFSVQSNTRHILLTWLIIDVALIIYIYKRKFFNKTVVISFFAFFLLLVISYFLPLNTNFTQESLDLNKQLSEKHENKYNYAKELFFAIEKKYTSPIRQYLLEPWKVFIIKDFTYFWNLEKGAYADSNIQGRIYQNLLFESGRFTKEEVTIHQSFCSNSPHLLVKISHPEREPIWTDFWAVDNFPGRESNRSYEFGLRTIRPCKELIGTGY